MCTHIHTDMQTHTIIQSHIHIYIHTCMRVHTYIHTDPPPLHVQLHPTRYVPSIVCMRPSVHLSVHACPYTCNRHVQCIHIHMYICTFTQYPITCVCTEPHCITTHTCMLTTLRLSNYAYITCTKMYAFVSSCHDQHRSRCGLNVLTGRTSPQHGHPAVVGYPIGDRPLSNTYRMAPKTRRGWQTNVGFSDLQKITFFGSPALLADPGAGGFVLTYKEDPNGVSFDSEVSVRGNHISGISWAKIEVGPMLLQGPEQHESPVMLMARSTIGHLAPPPPGGWPTDLITLDMHDSLSNEGPVRVWVLSDGVFDTLHTWVQSR